MLQNLKQKINIKYFMVAYVGFLLIFSSYTLGDPERFIKGLILVFLYACFDLLWTYIRDKMWYLPVSSWISGLILALVAIPNPSLLLILFLPLLAVTSKQLLHFGKMRHILNPASFAMATVAIFTPAISWWGVAWGTQPLIIASLVGIFILWRQNRWHISIPFLASYAILLSAFFLWNGIPATSLLQFIRPQLLDGTIIFFATVMLIEPLTSSFPNTKQRIFYGILVAFSAILVTYLSQQFAWENQDPLVYGLLLGNLIASLLFLPKKISQLKT